MQKVWARQFIYLTSLRLTVGILVLGSLLTPYGLVVLNSFWLLALNLLYFLVYTANWLDQKPLEQASDPIKLQPQLDVDALVIDQLRFAVLQIDANLQCQLLTTYLPKSLGGALGLRSGSLVEILSQLSRVQAHDWERVGFQLRHAFGMDSIQWSATVLGLPVEAELAQGSGFMSLRYIPDFDDDRLSSLHIILQDISEIKEREGKADQQRRDMEKFFALLQVPDSLFELFMTETRRLFDEIKQDLRALRESKGDKLQPTADRMFRAVHTIKANAKLFKLLSIQDVAHHVEDYLESLRSGEQAYAPIVMAELTQKIMTISEEVYSYASIRKEMLATTNTGSPVKMKFRIQWIRSLMSQFSSVLRDPTIEPQVLVELQREFGRALSSFDRASLRDYLPGYNQMLREVAGGMGKKFDEIEASLEFHHFDATMLARINDVLLHCLRNAIDHGIETVEQRVAAGKPAQGRISLTCAELDGMVQIQLDDDGRGLDVQKVKNKAIKMEIITAEAASKMSDEEVIPLLFHPGLSTAASVSEISGRGLGMDVIRDYVHGLGGTMHMSFVKGKSTSFVFRLPAGGEEILRQIGVFHVHLALQDLIKEMNTSNNLGLVLQPFSFNESHVFADRQQLVSTLRQVILDALQWTKGKAKLQLRLEEHRGRRRVDCLYFYRLMLGVEGVDPSKSADFWVHSPISESMKGKLRVSGGTVYLRPDVGLEINIPSGLPQSFSEKPFQVLIISARATQLRQHLEHFFAQVMGGWNFQLHTYPFAEGELDSIKHGSCLVVLDGHMLPLYQRARDEEGRKRDAIVLFPEEHLDVESLESSGIPAQSIMFVPPAAEERHLHRCLAGVILRQFSRDMIRDGNELARREVA